MFVSVCSSDTARQVGVKGWREKGGRLVKKRNERDGGVKEEK